MTDPRATVEIKVPAALSPERTAWIVLLLSFSVFLIFCAVLMVGVNYFIFQSDVTMTMLLTVGRGTVSITTEGYRTPQSVREQREVLLGTTITTGNLEQTTISFVDTRREWDVVAAVTLRSDTVASLINAQRPRFDWNTNTYRIDIGDFVGRMDVFVSGELDRGFWLTVQTQDGSLIYINETGRYIVEADTSAVRVFNREGSATIIAANQRDSRIVPEGQQGVIRLTDNDMVVLSAYADLLANPDFQQTNAVEQRLEPTVWSCLAQPIGDFAMNPLEGRSSLHLYRIGGGQTHAESRCIQSFQPANTGINVSQFEELILRATFNVQSQSLSGCGIEGSECPLILRVDYIDVNGNARQLYQGFYTRVDNVLDWPLTCESCTQDHEFINPGAWYTYETNLIQRARADERPGHILNIQFYASGHQYDVYVSEIALLGGSTTAR